MGDIATIDDFAQPQFTPEIRAIRDQMAELAPTMVMQPEAIVEQAMAETGLDELGDATWYLEALEVLCRASRDEADFSPMGWVSQHSTLVSKAKARLRIEDLYRQQPGISEAVVAPIVVVGMPRTGTTHLHNLLAADPSLRALPYWESSEPVPIPGEEPDADGHDPRWHRSAAACDFVDAMMPLFKRMHSMTPDHVHEEIDLLGLGGSSMIFETMAVMPSWRDWYLDTDQTPAYQYLRRVLAALQYLRGGNRWVLKSPQHLEQIAPLMNVFPDATIAMTYRDPVAILTSWLTMGCYTQRSARDIVDVDGYVEYWVDRVGDLLNACVNDRKVIPPSQLVDIHFDDFIGNDMRTVERVYAAAGQRFDDEAEAALRAYSESNTRDRFGKVAYNLAGFGVDVEAWRDRTSQYSEMISRDIGRH